MGEMVGSAVVQEVVSGAFSYMRNSHEESASQSHLMERLKMAYLELKFALERSRRMPITEVSLLQRRMELKHAFKECRDVLNKHTVLRVNLEDQGVLLSPSLPNRIIHAVKPFFSTGKGSISGSDVRRFEWFAEKADKFVRDVESGFSLARYRFSTPVITQLLEGNYVRYRMVSRSQTHKLDMIPSFLEDCGVVAIGIFQFKDLKAPMKCFSLDLMLRLSESTDIVGIWTKCLQSLEPQFKPVADFASGELAQISTQVEIIRLGPVLQERLFNWTTRLSTSCRPKPLCCIGDGFQPSAKNILSSELTKRFPEQITYLWFQCFISAVEHNLQSSAVETKRNTIKPCPMLQLSVVYMPHFLWGIQDDEVGTYSITTQGEICGPSDCSDLSKMAEVVTRAVECSKLEPECTEYDMFWFPPHGQLSVLDCVDHSKIAEVLTQAVDGFKIEPERTDFMCWCPPHGGAIFTVVKPTTLEMGCGTKVSDGSKTRRVSKRKR